MAVRRRRYTVTRRAENVNETRRRITEAAVALHGTLGPARTTISAVAERAGVQRLTVYRHFPDEESLFLACSSHWIAANPPPDPGAWRSIAHPRARLRTALAGLYAYYARTSEMWERTYRDLPLVEALRGPMSKWRGYLDGARDVLLDGWSTRDGQTRRLKTAIAHAVDFTAWASLARHGAASPAAAAAVMSEMVDGVARRRPGARARRGPGR